MNDYSAPRLNLQTKEGDWFRKELGNVYQMDEKVQNKGLEWIGIYWRLMALESALLIGFQSSPNLWM